MRPNLDYADMIYDKPLNKSFKRKIEMVQYIAALVITGAFKGTSCNEIYQELGLESLANRRWTRKLFFFFHKMILGLLPSYLKDYLIPCDNFSFPARTKTFESSFFPHFVEAWGNLSEELRNVDSINTFRSSILNFVRPRKN